MLFERPHAHENAVALRPYFARGPGRKPPGAGGRPFSPAPGLPVMPPSPTAVLAGRTRRIRSRLKPLILLPRFCVEIRGGAVIVSQPERDIFNSDFCESRDRFLLCSGPAPTAPPSSLSPSFSLRMPAGPPP